MGSSPISEAAGRVEVMSEHLTIQGFLATSVVASL